MTSSDPHDAGYRAACEAVERIIAPWLRSDHIQLHAGEMTAQELRSVKAVVGGIQRAIAEHCRAHLAEREAVCEETLQGAVLDRARMARIIGLAIQLKVFGRRATQADVDAGPKGFAEIGEFISSTSEMDLLQRSAEEAADKILAALSSADAQPSTTDRKECGGTGEVSQDQTGAEARETR